MSSERRMPAIPAPVQCFFHLPIYFRKSVCILLTVPKECVCFKRASNDQHTKGDTMKISKTTINMARRRGLAITVIEDDELNDGRTSVEFAAIDDGEPADEHAALYTMTPEGLFFAGGCGDTEEWPNWIQSESHLRALLPAMADEIR